jgi:hypothetical protein
MTFDFISQYLKYTEGNMSPKLYHMWSALSILAMSMGKRVYVLHDYYKIYPTLYVTLVGRQGIKKSTAKDLARDMFMEVFPDYPVSSSVTSREKIVSRLASDEILRTFEDENGTLIEYKPMAFFINELKNFMSINLPGMVDFLTDVYDRHYFDADTIKHGLQPVINPCINILACETPKWIIEKLKMNLITGGFSRRMVYVYVTERPARITFPKKTEESAEAERWCKKHLQKIVSFRGPFQWEEGVRPVFDKWFTSLPEQTDEVLEGYYETKDVLVQKVAMLLAMAQPEPKLVFTLELIQNAIAFIECIEENLPKLTIAAGRNELAVPQQQMLDLLNSHGGLMMEKDWHFETGRNMTEREYFDAKSFFTRTEVVKEFSWAIPNSKPKKMVWMIATAKRYREMLNKGEIVAA